MNLNDDNCQIALAFENMSWMSYLYGSKEIGLNYINHSRIFYDACYKQFRTYHLNDHLMYKSLFDLTFDELGIYNVIDQFVRLDIRSTILSLVGLDKGQLI